VIGSAFGDYLTICPVILYGEQFFKHSTSGNRFYSWMLTRPASRHIAGMCNLNDWLGVCHADELFFLFTISWQTKQEDKKLSADIIRSWAAFAKNANPGKVGDIQWTESLDPSGTYPSTSSFMALDYTFKMVHGYYKDTCEAFWKDKIMWE